MMSEEKQQGHKHEINYNMRCIEMFDSPLDMITNFDKLQHEMY